VSCNRVLLRQVAGYRSAISPQLVDIFSLQHPRMVKKDKKTKTAEQKARVTAKQNKKAAQKEKKGKAKGVEDSDADEVDLESVLEEYAKKVNCHQWAHPLLRNSAHSRSKHNFSGSPKHLANPRCHDLLLH